MGQPPARGAAQIDAQSLVRGVRSVHPGGVRVPGPGNVDPFSPIGQRVVVLDAVHGVRLAIGLRLAKGAGHSRRRVLGGGRDGRARGADDVPHVLAAVLPIHVQEDTGTIRGDHTVGPAGDVRQLVTGTRLLGVVAQPRSAPNSEPPRAQRKAFFRIALVAPLRCLESRPQLRDELHEESQQGSLGPLLGGSAALRHEGVRRCS